MESMMTNNKKTNVRHTNILSAVHSFLYFCLEKRFFELMQNKTEYCNSIVYKVLPMIYKVSDNYFIFS